jgi:N-acetylglucosaminyl-diphospho-decaprenol L-rhamnosyltransferase
VFELKEMNDRVFPNDTEILNSEETLLSVVIVTYNCLPFVRLCLHSLFYEQDKRVEVIVVDNNSADNVSFILPIEFPQIRFIANKENAGFGKACNQGIAIANGKYLLMLNPDTIVPENLTHKILEFMTTHPQCGGMGAFMTDGNGKYLPESKRGVPDLFRSFCRFSGFSAMFPKSKFFSGYYMGHLSIDEIHEVEILSGAFMVLSQEAVKRCNGFDERFFMYGEDIDLSWRIVQSGLKNYYNPNIKIIHFKGESTVKDKRYLKVFFGAMKQFYDIHFMGKQSLVKGFIVKIMIGFTGILSGVRMLFSSRKNSFPEIVLDLDYCIFSNKAEEVSERLSTILTGNQVFEEKRILTRQDLAKKTYAVMDLATLKPSYTIELSILIGRRGGKVLWVDSAREFLFYPVSASDKTHVFSV